MDITHEELEDMRNSYCEGCKGFLWIHESGCYEYCDGFQEEFKRQKDENL